MANFYSDNDDLRWYVDTGLDWEPIVRLTEYDFKAPEAFETTAEAVEFYQDVLGLLGEYTAENIAPRWKELDEAHPHLEKGEVIEAPVVQEVMQGLGELGIYGMCLPRELGGMNAPLVLLHIQAELLSRADVSIAAHVGFHSGIALAALSYSAMEGTTTFQTDPPRIVETRFAECIEECSTGVAWGSMDITEPHAGSDMGALRCKGEQDDAGEWFVTGQKIFITSGHGRWHCVIARTEPVKEGEDAFAGLKGLSMFLVPAYDTDEDGNKRWLATLDGVEEKLGHNASATVSISFERTPAHLIGKRGEGFKYMLLLMNNARVSVGFESIGCMEAAYRAAVDYAAQRPSMGKTIDKHEMVAEMLEDMQTDLQATRAVCMAAAVHEEIAQKAKLALNMLGTDDARREELVRDQKKHARRSREMTPLIKWYGSEKAVDAARKSIQIHGGSGYIKEYGVEKILRDAMVFPIYEGTSQIQALMAMKDNLLAAVKDPKRFMRTTASARWRSVSGKSPLEKRVASLRLLSQQTIQFLLSRLMASKVKELRHHGPSAWGAVLKDWDPKRDFALAMLHAERLTAILSDALIAEVLLEQVAKDPARTELLERFLERAEPRCRYNNDVITTTGLRLLRKLAEPESEPDAPAQAAK